MQFSSSFLSLALAMMAAVQAAPAAAHGHNGAAHRHSHVKRVEYDTSNVDWSKIDWAAVFGQKQGAAVTTTTAAAAVAVSTPNTVLAAAAVVKTTATTAAPAATQPAASTTKPVQATTPASTSGSSSSSAGGKRGIAWEPANGNTGHALFAGGSTTWIHNWGMSPSFDLSGKQFVYTVRTSGELAQLGSLPRGATVLGFNEPDLVGMSADEAAAAYKSQLAPLRASGAIGHLHTPSITNAGYGLPWLKSFMAACNGGCAIDELNIHWYGPNFEMLQEQVTAVHNAFPQYKITISEIAATNWNTATNPSPAQVAQFMSQATAWLDGQDWITRYAWFKGGYISDANLGEANSLMQSGLNALTSLGQSYNA